MDILNMSRRAWLATIAAPMAGAIALTALVPRWMSAMAPAKVIVYKDPSCGCCTKWVEHLRASGLQVDARDRTDMDALKDSLSVPATLRSCHTALAGRYVIEGHVPASDMKRLLATSPRGLLGLAVPGMPAGAPGMEMPGRADRYDVIGFSADGSTKLFAHH